MTRALLFLLSLLASLPAYAQQVPNPMTKDGANAQLPATQVNLGITPSITAYGAKCDGTTDDYAAITAAMASGYKTIAGPDNGVCRSSGTVIVPTGSTLRSNNAGGLGFGSGHPGGFVIKCDLVVSPCIRLDGGGTTGSSALVNVSVDRPDGAIPAGVVGVQLDAGLYPVVENVASYRNAIGFEIKDDGAYGGLGGFLNRLLTCIATEAHIKINGWREVRINQSRFGCNGPFDAASQQFVLMTGGHGDGPNTIIFVNTQFSMANAKAGCWLRFANLGSQEPGPTNMFVFDTILVEQIDKGICTDSSVTKLSLLYIQNSHFYGGLVGGTGVDAPFFDLNPVTNPESWRITNNTFNSWGSFILAPTASMHDVTFSNNWFQSTGPVGLSLNGGGGSSASLSNNRYEKVTLAGAWGSLNVSGVILPGVGVGVTNTATGLVEIDIPGYSATACPAGFGLTFGGASTGITYAPGGLLCTWQRKGNQITLSFMAILTSKGSAVGNAQFVGLPYVASGNIGVGNAQVWATNMTGLTGNVVSSTGAGATLLHFAQASATGQALITNTNFTNTSTVQGTIVYATDPGLR